MMFNSFQKIQSDLLELAKEFSEEKSIKDKEEHERKRQVMLDFFKQQKNIEYNKIKQIKLVYLGNNIEDYVSMDLYDGQRIVASVNNFIGIDFVDGIHEEVVEDLFRFVFNKGIELTGIGSETTLFFNF